MNVLRVVVILVAVVNPVRALLAFPDGSGAMRRAVLIGAVPVTLAAILLAAAAGPILGFLDVSEPSFRFGAGAVMTVGGLRMLTVGPSRWADLQPGRFTPLAPVAFPVLFTPELAAAAISYSADDGLGAATAGILVAMAAAVGAFLVASGADRHRYLAAVGRLGGAVVVVAAVAAVVSGIRDL